MTKKIFENWRGFKKLTLEQQIIQEISDEYAENVQDWFAENGGKMALPFGDVLGGEMREVVPMGQVISPRSPIGKLMNFFEVNGYNVDFANGLATKEIETQKGTQIRKQKIGKALQQALRLKKAEREASRTLSDIRDKVRKASDKFISWDEYMEYPEIKKANDKWISANEKFTKAFPREIMQSEIEEFVDFWNKKSQFYRENPDAVATEYSIVVSRHPIDVLRMSDFKMIHSCHSEGSEYFHCALSEARGEGMIAYVVESEDLKEISLADDEIFEDDDRGIDGMEPIARIRLRRFNNQERGYDLALPESKVYGVGIPGFKEAIKKWAIDKQKDTYQHAISEGGEIDDEYMNEFVRMGGSYQSDADRTMSYQMFNDFFSQHYPRFRGNVKWVGDESEFENDVTRYQQMAQEFEDAGSETDGWVSRNLTHSWFSYEVYQEYDEEPPHIYFNGGMSFEFSLNGPKAESFPDGWRERGNLAERLWDSMSTYHSANDYNIEEYRGDIEFRVDWSSGDYSPDPDGMDSFAQDMEKDDNDYEEHVANIKQVLIEEGYIKPTQIDILRKRFEEEELKFEHFDIQKSDEGGWEIQSTAGWGKVGLIRNNPVDIFNHILGKSGWSPIGSRFTSSVISKKVFDSMAKEMVQAIKDSKKQLKLAFGGEQLELPLKIDTTPQKVEDYVLQNFLLVLGAESARDPWKSKETPYGKRTKRSIHIERVRFVLDDETDAATINSAINLIGYIDKNIESFKSKIEDLLQAMDDKYEKHKRQVEKETEGIEDLFEKKRLDKRKKISEYRRKPKIRIRVNRGKIN